MKAVFILALIFSANLHAVLDIQLAVKPNKKYLNYFLEGYLPWLEKTFHYQPSLDSKEGNEFLKDILAEIDHWRVPEKPSFNQILFGQGFTKEKKPFYTFRIFIHPSLRQHKYLKAKGVLFDPEFIERMPDGKICYLKFKTPDKSVWDSLPYFAEGPFLAHYCGKKTPDYYSIYSELEMNFPNPFKGHAKYEIRTYSKEDIESIFYFVKNTHIPLLMPYHWEFVIAHGRELLVPFDKYSVDKNGNIIIYYP